jgi:hypothetical protein
MPANAKTRKKKPATPVRHEIPRTECWEYLDDQRDTLLQTVVSYRELLRTAISKQVQEHLPEADRAESMRLIGEAVPRLEAVVNTTNHLYSQHQGKTGDALRTSQIEFLQFSENYMVVNHEVIDINIELIGPLKEIMDRSFQ